MIRRRRLIRHAKVRTWDDVYMELFGLAEAMPPLYPVNLDVFPTAVALCRRSQLGRHVPPDSVYADADGHVVLDWLVADGVVRRVVVTNKKEARSEVIQDGIRTCVFKVEWKRGDFQTV